MLKAMVGAFLFTFLVSVSGARAAGELDNLITDLSLSISTESDQIGVNETFRFRITVENKSERSSNGSELSLLLPSAGVFLALQEEKSGIPDLSGDAVVCASGDGFAPAASVVCQLGNVSGGKVIVLNLDWKAPEVAGLLTLSGDVTGGSEFSNLEDDRAEKSVVVNAPPENVEGDGVIEVPGGGNNAGDEVGAGNAATPSAGCALMVGRSQVFEIGYLFIAVSLMAFGAFRAKRRSIRR